MLGDAMEDPSKLTGSAMNEEEYLIMIESSEAREMSFLHFQIIKNMMCNFFNEREEGAKLALERGDTYEKKNGSPLAMVDFLHQGISLFSMANKTKDKRHNAALSSERFGEFLLHDLRENKRAGQYFQDSNTT